MNYIQNLLRTAIITILACFVFGPSHPGQAAQEQTDQFSCANVTEIPQIECEALVAMYNPETKAPHGWLETTTPCNWSGITCEGNHITRIGLYNEELNALPAQIGNLTELTGLGLRFMDLNSLPAEIGNLTNLTSLNLNSNQLSSLPTEIGNLTNLTSLSLSGNQLSSLPTEIDNLNNLTRLSLEYNQLISLPITIRNLTNLNHLFIDYNRLIIPDNNLRFFLTWYDSNWIDTQTTPPVNIKNSVLGENSVELTWSPIAFQDKGGYYEISVATDDTFTVHGTTTSKSDSRYMIDGLTSGTDYDIRIRTYTPAHSLQQNELWSAYSPVISATTLYPVDAYESDNQCAEATQITIEEAARTHNFHNNGDTDWAIFTAPAPSVYRIEAIVPDGSLADVDLAYYIACDGVSVGAFTETFTPDARLDVEADTAGQSFYIQAKNADAQRPGRDVNYELSVHQMSSNLASLSDTESSSAGPAIVVAGWYRMNDIAQVNIRLTAFAAHSLFKAKGRTQSDIYFVNADPAVVGSALESLQLAIEDWAKEKLSEEGVSQVLTLYLVGRGDPNKFYLDMAKDEILTPEILDEWLTALEETIPDLQVNVLIDASHSGSFIMPQNGSISKEGRVIITSAGETQNAVFSHEGVAFSDNFITFLRQDYNLGYSYLKSVERLQAIHNNQEPWIDGDGDGEPNETVDIAVASQRSLAENGMSESEWPPYIATAKRTENRGMAVEVRHKDGSSAVEAVWAVVYPPDYEPPTGQAAEGDAGTLDEQALDMIEFVADDEAQFVEEEAYDDFTQRGVYQVIVHARDVNGLVARPMVVEVDNRYKAYLPVIGR